MVQLTGEMGGTDVFPDCQRNKPLSQAEENSLYSSSPFEKFYSQNGKSLPLP